MTGWRGAGRATRWLAETERRPMQGSTEALACPECGGSQFLLTASGLILCANDECYTLAGEWGGR